MSHMYSNHDEVEPANVKWLAQGHKAKENSLLGRNKESFGTQMVTIKATQITQNNWGVSFRILIMFCLMFKIQIWTKWLWALVWKQL